MGQGVLDPPIITIKNYSLSVVHEFTYLGSSSAGSLTLDQEQSRKNWVGSFDLCEILSESVVKWQADAMHQIHSL